MIMNNNQFVFNLSFDLPESVTPKISEDILPLIYNQDDLDQAVAEAFGKGKVYGYEEGYVNGELKAITERQLQIQGAMVHIYQSIDQMLQIEQEMSSKMHEALQKIIKTILQKIIPYYCSQHGVEELLYGLKHIFSTIIEPQPIVIFLAPMTINDVSEKIVEIQNRYQERVELKADEMLNMWECRVEWKGGGAQWSQPQMLEKIENLFSKENHIEQ